MIHLLLSRGRVRFFVIARQEVKRSKTAAQRLVPSLFFRQLAGTPHLTVPASTFETPFNMPHSRHQAFAVFTSTIVRFSDENETPTLKTRLPEKSYFSA